MDEDKKLIERKLLYSEVWSQPITKLAPQYGISDVGLKKICRALNVPTPPRGYWAKVQNNINVAKIPLPKLKSGQPSTYTIQKRDLMNQKPDNIVEKLSDEAVEIISALKAQKPIINSDILSSDQNRNCLIVSMAFINTLNSI
jgi:hypothetical protein